MSSISGKLADLGAMCSGNVSGPVLHHRKGPRVLSSVCVDIRRYLVAYVVVWLLALLAHMRSRR